MRASTRLRPCASRPTIASAVATAVAPPTVTRRDGPSGRLAVPERGGPAANGASRIHAPDRSIDRPGPGEGDEGGSGERDGAGDREERPARGTGHGQHPGGHGQPCAGCRRGAPADEDAAPGGDGGRPRGGDERAGDPARGHGDRDERAGGQQHHQPGAGQPDRLPAAPGVGCLRRRARDEQHRRHRRPPRQRGGRRAAGTEPGRRREDGAPQPCPHDASGGSDRRCKWLSPRRSIAEAHPPIASCPDRHGELPGSGR